jgi:hypothetical protein
MIYWFPDSTQAPEHIRYSRIQWQADEQYLHSLVTETRSLPPDGFDMTDRAESCAYCVYRSLCDRGTCAGNLQNETYEGDSSGVDGLVFDLEQIAEVSF